MKYIKTFILLLALLIVTVSCKATPPAATNAPVREPSPSPSSPAPAQPLRLGELVADNLSIDEIVQRYGPYQSYETAYSSENRCAYVRLHFSEMTVTLESQFSQDKWPSFMPENQEEGFDFGQKDVVLTDEDRYLHFRVHQMLWTDPSVEGPRGTKIGDAQETVMASYLDRSASYGGEWIYKGADVDANFHAMQDIPEGATLQPRSDCPAQVEVDHLLSYYANEPGDPPRFYEYTFYYLREGVVVAIEQGHSPGEA